MSDEIYRCDYAPHVDSKRIFKRCVHCRSKDFVWIPIEWEWFCNRCGSSWFEDVEGNIIILASEPSGDRSSESAHPSNDDAH